ncbi:hypothetical protein [Rhodobacter sp. NSM]|uniref:hypothetical protein n=1 Tax=Rhodobacter sp. NSM TaxID=3457501 RepID=UPI003FD630F2
MAAEGSLEVLLDEMRQSMIAGDLASLGSLEGRIAAAMEQPLGTAERARQVRAKAARNLACIEAAARGVRAARRRLEEIRTATSGAVVVYDGRGRRAETLPEPLPRQRL